MTIVENAQNNAGAAPGADLGAYSGAVDGSGFVDFYEMLGAERASSTIQLRSRINEMYGEAQANRDHRNLDKRAQYATMLFWLPVCRAILLHEGKRAKYDAYAEQAAEGQAPLPFKPFLDELAELPDGIGRPTSAPLSVRSERTIVTAPRPAQSVAPAQAATLEPAPKPPSPIMTAAPDGPAQSAPAVSQPDSVAAVAASRGGWVTLRNPTLRRELMGLVASAGGGLLALAALFVARAGLHQGAAPSVAGAVVVGILGWLALRAALVGRAKVEGAQA